MTVCHLSREGNYSMLVVFFFLLDVFTLDSYNKGYDAQVEIQNARFNPIAIYNKLPPCFPEGALHTALSIPNSSMYLSF